MRGEGRDILILNRSFWPDIEATGQFLTELCEELAKSYKVTVIAGRSYYVREQRFRPGWLYRKEVFNGIEILRVRHTRFWKANFIGRMINWLTYGVLSFVAALSIRTGLVIACTDPPILGIIAMLISRLKSVPFICNCQDLYPDIALGLGKLKKGFLSYAFDYLNKKAFSAATFVICLGATMKEILKAKGILESRIRVIPDWVDTSLIKPVAKNDNPLLEKLGLKKDKFIIMYSGNLGLSQDFSPILDSLALMRNRDYFYLLFVGEGAAKEGLKEHAQRLGLKNILFLPYQPLEMLSFSLSMADLHLVPLKKGLAGLIVPSKVYGIMAAGRPYLAITERESEPARLAEEFKCGLWAAPDNIEAIVDTLKWALTHSDELKKMGQRARQIAETKFDKNIVIDEWFKILDSFNSPK